LGGGFRFLSPVLLGTVMHRHLLWGKTYTPCSLGSHFNSFYFRFRFLEPEMEDIIVTLTKPSVCSIKSYNGP